MTTGFRFPQLLSYTGSLKPSLGFFFALNDDKRQPVTVEEESLRGVIANYGAEKKGQNTGRPNLQLVDRAHLPASCRECEVSFTLTILGNALRPHACNNPEAAASLAELVSVYASKGGFEYLAGLYADNIVRGRWLWRNKSLAQQLDIEVKAGEECFVFTLQRHGGQQETLSAQSEDALARLTQLIADALAGRSPRCLLEISARLDVGAGQEIYPSQELPLEGEDKRAGGHKKSRLLASTPVDGVNQAVLHSQKIGNALRTIDRWYPEAEPHYPLAIEPFGVDGGLQTAHRTTKQSSFYGLLESHYQDYLNGLGEVEDAAQLNGEMQQLHFVIGCLIRGGVYSNEKSKN